MLIPEAQRRAVEGTREGVFYRGELGRDEAGQPAYQRRFSDALLIRLLEKHDPSFRPHQVVENRPAGPRPEDLDALSPAARAALEEFLRLRARDAAPPPDASLPPSSPSPEPE